MAWMKGTILTTRPGSSHLICSKTSSVQNKSFLWPKEFRGTKSKSRILTMRFMPNITLTLLKVKQPSACVLDVSNCEVVEV